MWWFAFFVALAYIIYVKVIKPMGYWKDRDLPYKRPWPIIGNMVNLVLQRRSFVEAMADLYKDFPGRRYNGIHMFTRPEILIRDPELIKQITVKDFEHFLNRTVMIPENAEPLLTKNLAVLSGQKWRDMRATLSPSFTSSKLKFMFKLISDCALQFTDYFEGKEGSEVAELDMKDTFTRFTNDAIATSAFGVTVDSLKDRENEFYLMGSDSGNLSGFRAVKFFGYSIFPSLMRFFNVSIFPKSVNEFFRRVVRETIEARESRGIVRPDMIHLLLESQKGQKMQEEEVAVDAGFAAVEESEVGKRKAQQKTAFTDDDITAQAMVFFFGGFETTSLLMCFMSYELAVNPEVQKRLQEEIDEVVREKEITYEAVLGLKYLDMVVSETLRKWPPGVAVDRICVKDFTIQPQLPDEKPFTVKKGESVLVPVMGIHLDPEYFPNPDKFDPERFSEENRGNIVPYTYMPFGVGPRNCIASRFALMETKIVFFHLLSKFDLVPVQKTCIPMQLSKRKITMAPNGGFWLGFKKRKPSK